MPIENEQVQAVSEQVRSGEKQRALELLEQCKKFHITFMTKQVFCHHFGAGLDIKHSILVSRGEVRWKSCYGR